MELTEKDLKHLKSLHVISKIPICILDNKQQQIQLYNSDFQEDIVYPNMNSWEDTDLCLKFDHGDFQEIFISLLYKEHTIIWGPVLTQQVKDKLIAKKMSRKYTQKLPVYSLGDIRDFVIMLGGLLNTDLESIYSAALHRRVIQNQTILDHSGYKNRKITYLSTEKYSFYYENRILGLVSKGDMKLLKKEIADLGCSVVPTPSSDSLRSEKNYTIIIAEKLCALAIHSGNDIIDSIKLRDFYVKSVEEQTTLTGVLSVRDSAIIHFTKELHDIPHGSHSPAIIAALQYINLNIYNSIKITDITKHVFMSESALRHNFKKEMNITITDYIMKRKISESKLALQSGMTISEVSKRMGFYDSSHFHRIFKKQTGMTPRQFLDNVYQLKIFDKPLSK